MKKLILFLCCTTIISCEEVIDVNLETETPRLVIDAAINWEKGTSGSIQTIRLTTTTGYFKSQIPTVSGATISVTNSTNTVFNFVETPNTGNYICTNFTPVLNENYKLTVIYNGQTYIAEEKLIPSPPILDVEQTNDLGINNDEIGIKINFKDFADQRNYYLFRYDSTINPFPEYQIIDDQFTDGKTMSWLYSHKNLVRGKTINFTQYGVSPMYSNYMRLIIGASSGANNGPFQVIPTRVRGNIINQTNPENYVLGYFRLCEVAKSNYTIK